MTAPDEDWAAIDRLLTEALDLDEGALDAWLQRLHASDPRMGSRIEKLLSHASKAGALDAVLQAPVSADALSSLIPTAVGATFGPWVVQTHLGSGGMSEVYLARRALEEGEQFAALKLIPRGLDRPEALAKFVKEAAILSQLNDPRIARLVDSGRSAEGQPWLAMEYVDGDPLDAGCDARALGIRERVALLIDVALAVDHAHRHLVVHRDIKPANVLLARDGLRVRLLDFGIAKVLDDTGPNPTHATRAFTLSFASPEQLAGGSVSTASDVYQLGGLLFLLLTGTRPFRHVEQNPAALLAAMHEGAPAPSATVTVADAFRHPTRCGMRADRLASMLKGDLDTIALKAMAFEPQRRYLSARELADDLQRWLNGEPIAARPEAWYRVVRRARKHWALVAAASVMLLLIVAYATTVTLQRRELQVERDAARKALARADATRRFLVRILGTANPVGAEQSRDLRDVLIDATDAVEAEFGDQPEVAAETYTELGLVFQGMEDAAQAERAFRRALEIVPPEAPSAPNARAIGTLAIVLADLGQPDDARALLAQHFDRVVAHYGGTSDEHVGMLIAKSRVLQAAVPSADDKPAVEAEILQTLERARVLHATLHPPGVAPVQVDAEGLRSDIEGSIGLAMLRTGQTAQALPYLRRHFEQQLALHGPNAARTLSSRMNLATALQKSERYDESGLLLTGMVDELRREYGTHPNRMVAFALGSLGNQAKLTKAFDQSADYWAQAATEAEGAMGVDHPWIATARFKQAEALVLGGRQQEAIALLEAIVRSEGRSDDLVTRAQALLDRVREDVRRQ